VISRWVFANTFHTYTPRHLHYILTRIERRTPYGLTNTTATRADQEGGAANGATGGGGDWGGAQRTCISGAGHEIPPRHQGMLYMLHARVAPPILVVLRARPTLVLPYPNQMHHTDAYLPSLQGANILISRKGQVKLAV
jgi:hypothetical protein